MTTVIRDGRGHPPGFQIDTSYRFSCSTWHPKSTDESLARRTCILTMNSSVISATSTQVFKALHPTVSSTSVSFKMGMVTDAPLSVVTRHGLSHIQHSAIRLSLPLFASALRVKRGDGGDGAGVSLITPALPSIIKPFLQSWLSMTS